MSQVVKRVESPYHHEDRSFDQLKCQCGRIEERNNMAECCHQWWCLRCSYIPDIKTIKCPICMSDAVPEHIYLEHEKGNI
jgi:hypothetical protein